MLWDIVGTVTVNVEMQIKNIAKTRTKRVWEWVELTGVYGLVSHFLTCFCTSFLLVRWNWRPGVVAQSQSIQFTAADCEFVFVCVVQIWIFTLFLFVRSLSGRFVVGRHHRCWFAGRCFCGWLRLHLGLLLGRLVLVNVLRMKHSEKKRLAGSCEQCIGLRHRKRNIRLLEHRTHPARTRSADSRSETNGLNTTPTYGYVHPYYHLQPPPLPAALPPFHRRSLRSPPAECRANAGRAGRPVPCLRSAWTRRAHRGTPGPCQRSASRQPSARRSAPGWVLLATAFRPGANNMMIIDCISFHCHGLGFAILCHIPPPHCTRRAWRHGRAALDGWSAWSCMDTRPWSPDPIWRSGSFRSASRLHQELIKMGFCG